MCGIAGIIAENVSDYKDNLDQMLRDLSHRGPDGSGTYFFKNCALGHTRLSIVDLSTGAQPMHSPVSPAAITFNGEIYGYKDIRTSVKDFPFRTTSDTEVILALYYRYGKNLLSHLTGMFAFALWNDESGELICARDRFGEKPFYYAIGPEGEFIFASEIKAIVNSGLLRPKLDKLSLAHFLKRLYVPVDRTIYENIYTLPPSHYLVWRNGTITLRRYWDLPEPDISLTMNEAVEKFRCLMQTAVDEQLVADVEIGAFLSGGLDSSTIVALAAAHTSRIKTIAFGFGSAINELPYAREIAERYGTEHIEIVDSDFNLADLMLEMSIVYDEPFADSSNIPTFLICRHAAKELKVVLTGDGADELLAGYDFWYRPLYLADKTSSGNIWKMRLAVMLSTCIGRLGKKIPRTLSNQSAGYNLRKNGSLAEAHDLQNVYFNDRELTRLGLLCPRVATPKLYGGVDDALRMDLVNYMPGDILVKTDRASMANGLELRTPFLNVDLASFLISLPVSLKIDAVADKKLLRQAFADRWTPIIRRRAKQGFGAPVSTWLERDDMKMLVHDSLRNPAKKIFGYFDRQYIENIAGENSYRTWIMLVLSIWMENHDFKG